MKTKLLIVLLLAFLSNHAQVPVTQIFPDDETAWEITTSGSPLDEPAGADQTWVFDQLVSLGQTVYTHETPTAGDIATYPGTNGVLAGTETGSIFFNATVNTQSITGVAANDLNINYATNNAAIGTFPMAFGYSNSDTTAGTYSGMGYSGTFSGTIDTTVDAYGTLTANILYDLNTIEVTRVKIVQTLSLNYLIFTGIGTATQTINTYFNEMTGPVFRTTTLVIDVPQLGINETTTTYEAFIAELLATPEASAEKIAMAPNPVENAIYFSNGAEIESVEIFDISGKSLLTFRNPASEIDVNGLSRGIYIATIKTAAGSQTRKFVKK